MNRISEREKKLYELIKKHIQNEKELIHRLEEGSELEPINLETKKEWLKENFEIEEEIRELLGDEFGSLKIQERRFRDQLRKIGDKKSRTRKYYDDIELSELANTLGISEDILKKTLADPEALEELSEIIWRYSKCSENMDHKISERSEEERIQLDETLNEMIEDLQNIAGDSISYVERKKDFGTVFINRSIPPEFDSYLGEIKIFFLLNQFEAVIGFSRILLEIACQRIFDDIPERIKGNLRNINGEFGAKQKIREACQYRSKSSGKNKEYINHVKELAQQKYDEASHILHGELPNPKTEQDALDFAKAVFSVIEALYSC